MTHSAPWQSLSYSFDVDEDMPYGVGKKIPIFNLTKADVAITPLNKVRGEEIFSNSETTCSQKIAAKMGVEGSYGAFSGSASMAVDTESKTQTKTIRLDKFVNFKKDYITGQGDFLAEPAKKLTDAFRKIVAGTDVRKLQRKIGLFYADSANLGASVQKTYIMEATSKDNSVSMKSELKASYGTTLMGVTGTASCGTENRKAVKGAKMKTMWTAQGGKASIWLGVNCSEKGNFERTQEKWADSVNDKNLFCYDLKLSPLYDLVKEIDYKKGERWERFLKEKWERDASKFNPKSFLKAEAMMYDHKNCKWMVERCKGHRDWCKGQAATAQSWVDSWTAAASRKRNSNWKWAANSGKDKMNEIMKYLTDRKHTVDDARDYLRNKEVEFDAASKMNWGMGGHDSVKSNEMQRHHRDCVKELRRKI